MASLLLGLLVVVIPHSAHAQQRHALILTGATGGPDYASRYRSWSQSFIQTLTGRMGFDPARIVSLSETEDPDRAATAANVRRYLSSARSTLQRGDTLLVLLIGHGTFDGVDAKFNLVGPDLEAADWASLVRGIRARLIFVNAAPASFPFLQRLSGPHRIVISATDSAAQRFDTVFPEHFIAAFSDDSSDLDKNGRVSIWEAFVAADARIRTYYQERGQLTTERPLLDDDGDGVGRDAAAKSGDGSMASRTYLDASSPDARPTDEVLLRLLQQRAALEREVDDLKVKKAFMQPLAYATEFERLIIELARVSQAIRARQRHGS